MEVESEGLPFAVIVCLGFYTWFVSGLGVSWVAAVIGSLLRLLIFFWFFGCSGLLPSAVCRSWLCFVVFGSAAACWQGFFVASAGRSFGAHATSSLFFWDFLV